MVPSPVIGTPSPKQEGGLCIHLPSPTPMALKQLDSLIKRAGFVPEQFTITSNQVPNGTKVLIAMGEESLRLWTGEAGIMRWRGRVLQASGLHIVPTFDPGFLLPKRGQESSSKYVLVVIHDLRRAVALARDGFQRKPTQYLLDPSPQRALDFAREYEASDAPYLCPDIETTGKLRAAEEDEIEDLDFSIQRVGYAFRPGYAMSIPWQGPWMDVHKRLLENPRAKTTWNGKLFDGPVLRANGVALNGPHHDAMWVWHTYMPNLPKKLEFVSSFCTDLLAWKHLAKSEFARYSCFDVDANLQIMLWLESTMRGIAIPEYSEVAA